MDAYEKIVSNIRKEDLETTMLTISKIKQVKITLIVSVKIFRTTDLQRFSY